MCRNGYPPASVSKGHGPTARASGRCGAMALVERYRWSLRTAVTLGTPRDRVWDRGSWRSMLLAAATRFSDRRTVSTTTPTLANRVCWVPRQRFGPHAGQSHRPFDSPLGVRGVHSARSRLSSERLRPPVQLADHPTRKARRALPGSSATRMTSAGTR